jgi:ribosomal protein S18
MKETTTPAFTYSAQELADKLKVSTARLSQMKKQFELEQNKHYFYTDNRTIKYYQSAYNKLKNRPIVRLSSKYQEKPKGALKPVKKSYGKQDIDTKTGAKK